MSKTIIITGASDGIGKAAARELQALGNEVVLVGRSPEKTRAAAQELDAAYYIADFANLMDVRKLAKAIKSDYKHIDVLALNAGGIFSERTITRDKFEQTFQVNHLAHFLLVGLLMNTLLKSHATIIATSSAANYLNQLDLNDLNASHGYRKWIVYANAKLMNIMFVRELNRRYGAKGIASAAFHPGIVASSFSRELSRPLKVIFQSRIMRLFGIISPRQAADTLVWLATHEAGKTWKSGEYYSKRQVKRASAKAYNPLLANELWNKSEDLLMDTLEY